MGIKKIIRKVANASILAGLGTAKSIAKSSPYYGAYEEIKKGNRKVEANRKKKLLKKIAKKKGGSSIMVEPGRLSEPSGSG